MYKSKFSKIQPSSQSSQLSLDTNPYGFTTFELYPRMRRTELYRQAAIPEEYQVREFEHPRRLDCPKSILMENTKKEKIVPPNNSEMRILRDSYFS